jgi:nitrogenase molybdenum-iron protein beta chain
MTISRITGVEIPESLAKERGRLVDAIADSSAHIHGKKFAIYGDPDLCLRPGGIPAGTRRRARPRARHQRPHGGKRRCRPCSTPRPSARTATSIPGKDLWHMRSLLFTEPVDFLIGNTYGKYLERDTGTPLIRIGFPIFDRHHHHRYPVWGYQGGLNVLVWILDKIFDDIDKNTNVPSKTDYSFDIIR